MKKLIIGVLIFLTVFTLTSIGTTYMLISSNNSQSTSSHHKKTGIDLYGTYNENDLIINEITETYNGIDVEISQISGLKDGEVESKINQHIRSTIYERLDSLEPTEKIHSAYASASKGFSNIISVEYVIYLAGYIDTQCSTYKLTDGNRLKLEDVFIENADIQSIVKTAFYDYMLNTSYGNDYIEINESNYIVNLDENELYETVKGYMTQKENDFAVYPHYIEFTYKEHSATIDMIDIAESVAIYDKYVTDESLFVRDDIGLKNVITCAEHNEWQNIEYGYLEDNLWYDITIHDNPMFYEITQQQKENYNSFLKELRDEQYSKLDQYRTLAKNNPDKVYVALKKTYVSLNYERANNVYLDTADVDEKTILVEMPIEVYKNEYKDKMYDAYRRRPLTSSVDYTIECGVFIDNQAIDGVTYKEELQEKQYNIVTCQEITENQDN